MLEPKGVEVGTIVRYVMHGSDYGKDVIDRTPRVRPAIILDPPPITAPGGKPDTRIAAVILCGPEDGVGSTLPKAALLYSADEIPGTWHVPGDVKPAKS